MKFSITSKLTKIAVTTIGSAVIVASAAAADTPTAGAATDWQKTVNYSDRGGHVMGNPDAKFKIVEYASYTCGRCANFEVHEAPLLKTNEVAFGKVSFEVRNYIRDGQDLTVAILARCGGKDGFFARHNYWMSSLNQWGIGSGLVTTETQEKAKKNDLIGFVTGVYTDMRLAPHASKTGLTDEQARRCLGNAKIINAVLGMTNEAAQRLKIAATPTFLVNDAIAPGASSYATIKPFLVNK